jgi:hypothetical protein
MSTLEVKTAHLWRAFLQPVDGCGPELTVFVTAAIWEAAMRKITGVIAVMEYRTAEEVQERIYNCASAVELIAHGLSDDHALRLFETGWSGNRVLCWVDHPLILLPDPAPLLHVWMRIARSSQQTPGGTP